MTSQDTQILGDKLKDIGARILDIIKRYQKLEKDFSVSRSEALGDAEVDTNRFDVAVGHIKNKLNLCNLELQVLEDNHNRNATDSERMFLEKEAKSMRRIQELEESLKEATEKLMQQKALQREMELTFQESKQKRVEHMRSLLEELKKYMNHMDVFNL